MDYSKPCISVGPSTNSFPSFNMTSSSYSKGYGYYTPTFNQQLRFQRVSATVNGSTAEYIGIFQQSSISSPATFSASDIQRINDNFSCLPELTAPANSNNILFFPAKSISITDGGGFNNSIIYYPDLDNPVWLTWNNWSSYSVSSLGGYITYFPYIEQSEVIPDEPSGDTSDFSGIIGAITLIPATLIVIAFFTVIFKMFVNRRTRG